MVATHYKYFEMVEIYCYYQSCFVVILEKSIYNLIEQHLVTMPIFEISYSLAYSKNS